jgi:nucleotide-binding universal stress UspA family protein
MFHRIAVPYDGSLPSRTAFEYALEIAVRFGAELRVISVVRLPEPTTRVELHAVIEEGHEHFHAEFEALAKRAAERGQTLATEVLDGHPADQILRAAERFHADLIVMGRRGRSTVGRWLLGSISERVLRDAHCPTLVVH